MSLPECPRDVYMYGVWKLVCWSWHVFFTFLEQMAWWLRALALGSDYLDLNLVLPPTYSVTWANHITSSCLFFVFFTCEIYL